MGKRYRRGEEEGATAVEFGLLAIPIFALLIALFDYGYRFYGQSIVTGTLRTAARMASTGTYTGAQIDQYVRDKLLDFHPQGTVAIVKKSYADWTGVGSPEPVISGSRASGTYCFIDVNKNGSWSEDSGIEGLGQPEDVIFYEARLSYARLLPPALIFASNDPMTTLKANMIVSNEPFAARSNAPPPTVCVKP